MNKYLLITALFLFAAISLNSMGTDEAYEAVFNAQEKNTPESYEVIITGELIAKQLDTIPDDKFVNGKERALVILAFKKGYKPNVYIEGVESFYSTMFSVFVPYLDFTGYYLLVGQRRGKKAFAKRYKITKAQKEEKFITLHVKDGQSGKGEYAVFTLDNEELLIRSAKYYKGDVMWFSVKIDYLTVKGGYRLPQKIEFQNATESAKGSTIYFQNYELTQLSEGDFK